MVKINWLKISALYRASLFLERGWRAEVISRKNAICWYVWKLVVVPQTSEFEQQVSSTAFRDKALPFLYNDFLIKFFKNVHYNKQAFFWVHCFPSVLFIRVPEYFTGLLTLVLALERYILVVHPFSANELLTKRNRTVCYSILTLVSVLCCVVDVGIRINHYEASPKDSILCYLSPLGRNLTSANNSALIIGLFTYAIPAVVSLSLYLKVILVLLKKKTNVSRNRVLTLALFSSCVCWILTWALTFFCRSVMTYGLCWPALSSSNFLIQKDFFICI